MAIRSGGHSVAGAGALRGRTGDRHAAHERGQRRSRREDRDRRGRRHLERLRPRDRAARPDRRTGGRVSTTGVAGLTLGGGSGGSSASMAWPATTSSRSTLITADGWAVTASESENPELFWALHGGGGNFGVATELVFRLHPLPSGHLRADALARPRAAPRSAAPTATLIEGDAPDELGGGFAYITGPPEDFVPDHLQGKLVAGVIRSSRRSPRPRPARRSPRCWRSNRRASCSSRCPTPRSSARSTTHPACATTGRPSTYASSPTRP